MEPSLPYDGYGTEVVLLLLTLDESFFWTLRSDTKQSMGRVLDVVWCNIKRYKSKMGTLPYPSLGDSIRTIGVCFNPT